MDALVQEVTRLPIHHPVTVATNVALAVQCVLLGIGIGTAPGRLGRRWAGFFGWMAVATAVGAVKHGIGSSGSSVSYTAALVVSNLASAIAVHRAQIATALVHAPPGPRRRLSRFATVQLGCFAVWTTVFPGAAAAVVNAALGLVPVLACEAHAALRSRAGARWLVGGFGVAAVAALVYGAGDRLPGPLGATDAAHVVMLGAFALLGLGARLRLAGAARPVDIGLAAQGGTS